MSQFWRWMALSAIAFFFYGAACGGGGGSGTAEDVTGDETIAACAGAVGNYANAIEKLKLGDVAGARAEFSAAVSCPQTGTAFSAIKTDGSVPMTDAEATTKSYFGRAFTDMLLIAESQPISAILEGFGEQPWSLSSVFTESGLLGRAYAVNEAAVDVTVHYPDSDFAFEQQVGRSSMYRFSDPWPGYSIVGRRLLLGYANDHDRTSINTLLLSRIEPSGGAIVNGECAYQEGDAIGVSDHCVIEEGGEVEDRFMLNVNYGSYVIDRAQSTGSVSIVAAGSAEGDEVSVTFNDLTLFDGAGNMVTVAGTFADSLTDDSKLSFTGIPFSDACGMGWCLMSKVGYGYTSGDAVASIVQSQPTLEGIAADLEAATSDGAASFDIPHEFFFGEEDLHVNHSDMLFALSGAYFLGAALNVLNSFTADMQLSSLADADGNFVGSRAAIVSQLNQFFELKADNELSLANDNMAAGIDWGIQAIDALAASGGGSLTNLVMSGTDDAVQFFAEMREMLVQAQSSMGGQTIITAIDAPVDVNFSDLFAGNVDGAAIEYDPFVLENDSIKPVEEYFVALMGNVTDYDIHTAPAVKFLSQMVRDRWFLIKPQIFSRIYAARFGGYRAMPY